MRKKIYIMIIAIAIALTACENEKATSDNELLEIITSSTIDSCQRDKFNNVYYFTGNMLIKNNLYYNTDNKVIKVDPYNKITIQKFDSVEKPRVFFDAKIASAALMELHVKWKYGAESVEMTRLRRMKKFIGAPADSCRIDISGNTRNYYYYFKDVRIKIHADDYAPFRLAGDIHISTTDRKGNFINDFCSNRDWTMQEMQDILDSLLKNPCPCNTKTWQ